MNGKRKFVKAVAGPVSGAGILESLAMFLLTAFGAVSTQAQTSGFVYVANALSANVSAYTISDITGALTAVPGSPFPAVSSRFSVTVDPTGQFAYVANCGGGCIGGVGPGNVSAFTINGASSALTAIPGSPFPAGTSPFSVTVEPTGQFAYVANAASDNVSAYTIDATTGALTAVPGSPFPAGSGPRGIAATAGPAPSAPLGAIKLRRSAAR